MNFATTFLAVGLLTNAADVAESVHRSDRDVGFSLCGKIIPFKPRVPSFFLSDASGTARIIYLGDAQPGSGDIVRCSGVIGCEGPLGPGYATCTNLSLVSRGTPPTFADSSIAALKSGEMDYRHVRIRGTVQEIFRDEIDPDWCYVVLSDDGLSVYATFLAKDLTANRIRPLTGAYVSICGICTPWDYGARLQLGRVLSAEDITSVEVIRAASSDAFDIPVCSNAEFLNPEDMPVAERRRLTGLVIAVWQGTHLVVKDTCCGVHNIELAARPAPAVGSMVEVAGLLKTDLYRLNLTDAVWRPSCQPPPAEAVPQDISANALVLDENGNARINAELHGRPVRLQGVVQSVPPSDASYGTLVIKSGDIAIPIDISENRDALLEVQPGCTVAVSGICIIHSSNWSSYSAFPHATGVTIVIRKPADVRILARPPWWTTGRLLSVISTLLAVLFGILVWNVALRKAATRKGRELMREQIGHVKAELKTEERTRLAVELHDSLAQNLTGISLEIDTASKLADENRDAMLAHLGTAAQSLKSCRDELRNCLWDLRNRALEAKDMDTAIRQTLAPHVAGVELTVRFNVPRERFSDNTAHTILRIVRELTLNAIRHGKATKIRVAGSVDGERMLFSIRDNGCGFDPDAAPGFDKGHYGLLGIRERIDEFEGEFRISSSLGKGTKATISLKVPQES